MKSKVQRFSLQPDKKKILISQPKHMLWVLERTVSMRQFFEHPKHMFKLMGKKIITHLHSKNVLSKLVFNRDFFTLSWHIYKRDTEQTGNQMTLNCHQELELVCCYEYCTFSQLAK